MVSVFTEPVNTQKVRRIRDKRRKPRREAWKSGFQLMECSPYLPSVYIRLCKHGNHFTFLL